MKNKILLFASLLLIFIMLGIFLLNKKNKENISDLNVSNEKSSSKFKTPRLYEKNNFIKLGEMKGSEVPYRLLPFGNEAMGFYEKRGIYAIGTDGHLGKEIMPDLKNAEKAGNYFLHKEANLMAGFNIDAQIVFFVKDGKEYTSSSKARIENAFWFNGKIFTFTNSERTHELYFESWEPLSDIWKKEMSLNLLLKDMIGEYKQCLLNSFGGNFFKINDKGFGFYFYQGGYFITHFNNNFLLNKTIVDYPFRKYKEEIIAEKIDGISYTGCFAENDVFTQLSATGNKKYIGILSNVIKAPNKDRCIDFYDAITFNYIKSVALPSYKNALPTDILFSDETLWVSYENGNLETYKINDL